MKENKEDFIYFIETEENEILSDGKNIFLILI
jgi:hypothetical protein